MDEEFCGPSNSLMDFFREGRAVMLVSDVLLDELMAAPDAVKRILEGLSAAHLEPVAISEEAQNLQVLYLAAGIVGPASSNDALHVALATVARADMIVSWNFKHIVHFDKMRGFNSVNIREGYGVLVILSPLEVV